MQANNFITHDTIETYIDEEGNETTTKISKSTTIVRNNEPDYIKVYTKMWCEFNGVPQAYRELFLQLAIRMSYCNAADLEHAQWVNTAKPWSEQVKKVLNWGEKMYEKGLKALRECGAIRRVGRGVHQINPKYASKGEWKYNPRLQRGGVEDLIATFKFKEQIAEVEIVWADDGRDTEFNKAYRKALNVQSNESTVVKFTKIYRGEKNKRFKCKRL